ncbi:LON peptidase substrate-binding domain-containing protein [Nocardioides limicola]|uniref:LON peptidase substrate-binding domain-containing protein n=1 Tax=Nocardioides limicola TaxID=2803368 RepID=UPI00193C7201|nr:LON peptidase substrate-binding domain-containing protein [Nocardioides sp. DJM-14]
MTDRLPMFPLNTCLFPGLSVPLRVFEDRYTAMVRQLLEVADPTQRLFGSVAIRDGYEVGPHGAQSLYRIGCRLQLTEVEAHPDGTFDVVAVGRDRIRLEGLDASGPFPVGTVSILADDTSPVPEELVDQVRSLFVGYAAQVARIRGANPLPGTLPTDPVYLAWALAAVAPLPLPDQQAVLEAPGTEARLTLLAEKFRDELTAMNVLPSLPASKLARTGWSPN